jgi:REP element-mobilizing transposase RayT
VEWDATKKRIDKLPTSNPKSSMQEPLPTMIERESSTMVETRTDTKKNIVITEREKPRTSLPNRIKLKDRVTLTSDSDHKVHLEPIPAHPYDLTYACLMIPRFSSHYLIGDVAESLHLWMQHICVSFAWRLDNLTIRPDYMQWILSVPPATPPSRCFRTVREHTSKQIFEDFPQFKNENLSKDFWAPGYFVLLGNQPHPLEMINEYILLTRQQQGIQPRRSE